MLFALMPWDKFIWYFLLFICLAGIGFRKLARQFDDKGEIKDAAKGGIIRMIGRWLK